MSWDKDPAPARCTGHDLWAVALLGALLLITALTFSVSPMNGEDYALTRQFGDAGLVERLGWAYERSAYQASNWNARLGEQLSIVWLAMPETGFAVANLVSVSLLTLLLALFATPEKYWTSESLMVSGLFALAVIYLVWPRMEIFFWKTTAAGYLQPLVLTLLLLLPFHSSVAGRALLGKWWKFALFLVLALLCGISFENVPPALLPYMALVTYFNFKARKKFAVMLAVLALAYFLGWGLLMLAPSTQARSSWYAEFYNIPPASIAYFYQRAMEVLRSFVESSAGLLAALAVAVIASYAVNRRFIPKSLSSYILWLPAALCVGTLIKAPYIEPRAFALAWIIVVIAIVQALHETIHGKSKTYMRITVAGFGIFGVALGGQAFSEYLDYSRLVSQRAEMIKAKVGSADCRDGLIVSLIPREGNIRILNNREDWVAYNLDQVSRYFNCTLLLPAMGGAASQAAP